MPTQFAFRTVALVAIVAFVAGCLAAVANAQDAATAPPRTLVAAGSGVAKVSPRDPNVNASIVAAVEAAEDKALPAALKDARTQAAELAAAAGVTLGPLLSLSNAPTSGGIVFGPYSGAYGPFGPDTYCGKITTRPVTRDKNGKRHVGKPRTRRVCRAPSTVQRAVQLTFSLA